MVPDATAPVSRFHEVLVDEIRKQKPDYLRDSFTVAEIYQILVPYRSHRDALGVEMNGDYEDALLRLLAGAGDLVVLESPDARDRIRRELQSKNPNTGLFREFAASPVHLNTDHLPEGASDDIPAVSSPLSGQANGQDPAPAEEVHVAAPAPPVADPVPESITTHEAVADPEPVAPVLDESETDVVESAAESGPTYFDFETSTIAAVTGTPDIATPQPASVPDEPGGGIWKPGEHPVSTTAEVKLADCLWCDEQLPDRDVVNFCPHCGTSTKVKPCASCGTEMDMGWRFCISCGTESKGPLAKAS